MKKILFAACMLLLAVAAGAQNRAKFRIEGPEKSYNMVRISNLTHYSDFSCTVSFLKELDGTFVVESTLGTFHLKGQDDIDSNKVRTYAGQWIGISLPDELEGVNVHIEYRDLPMFDIVYLILTESAAASAPAVGGEF